MDRREVTGFIMEQTSMIVQSGPFAGMKIAPNVIWGDGDLAPKLLGTYEEELHPYISKFRSNKYGAIIDIGCAEGYYAVGASIIFPNIDVYAYDTNVNSLDVLKENALLNNRSENIHLGGLCTPEEIIKICEKHGKILIICDCEGGENEIFKKNSELQKCLANSDCLIECHDFINQETTSQCMSFFSQSHIVQNIYSAGRNPNKYPFLSCRSDYERWLAICEYRPTLMNWLICESRKLI